MTDRETVIQHFQDAIEASGNNNKWRFVRLDIIEKAIALLKEQEPMKPRYEYTFADGITRCGNCNSIIFRCYEYCPGCGRKVKWDADGA